MTNYKYFLKLAWRKLPTILIYLGIFIAISLLSSSGMKETQTDFTRYKSDLMILNEDQGQDSKELIKYLASYTNVADYDIKEAEAKEAIFNEVVSGMVVIPKDFSHKMAQGKPQLRLYFNNTNPRGAILKHTIEKYLLFARAQYNNSGKIDHPAVQQALAEEAKVSYTSNNMAGSEIKRWYQAYFTTTPYIFMSLFMLILGLIMSDYNEESLKKRTDILPISSTRFNLQIIAGQVTVVFLLMAAILTLGYAFKPQYNHLVNWPIHILNSICFCASALAMSSLMSAISTKSHFIRATSNVIALGLSFISGVFMPLDILPPLAKNLAHFFPLIYHTKATRQAMDGIMPWQNMGIMLLFALLYLVTALSIQRIKQGEDGIVRTLKKA